MKNISRRYIGGFTLIELLVVVLIIGILSAVVVPMYQKTVHKARIAEPISVMKTIHQAMEVYYMANGMWPTELEELDIEVPMGDWQYELEALGSASLKESSGWKKIGAPRGVASIAAWNTKLGGGSGKGALFYSIPKRARYKPGIFCCLYEVPQAEKWKEFCNASKVDDDEIGWCYTGSKVSIQGF